MAKATTPQKATASSKNAPAPATTAKRADEEEKAKAKPAPKKESAAPEKKDGDGEDRPGDTVVTKVARSITGIVPRLRAYHERSKGWGPLAAELTSNLGKALIALEAAAEEAGELPPNLARQIRDEALRTRVRERSEAGKIAEGDTVNIKERYRKGWEKVIEREGLEFKVAEVDDSQLWIVGKKGARYGIERNRVQKVATPVPTPH